MTLWLNFAMFPSQENCTIVQQPPYTCLKTKEGTKQGKGGNFPTWAEISGTSTHLLEAAINRLLLGSHLHWEAPLIMHKVHFSHTPTLYEVFRLGRSYSHRSGAQACCLHISFPSMATSKTACCDSFISVQDSVLLICNSNDIIAHGALLSHPGYPSERDALGNWCPHRSAWSSLNMQEVSLCIQTPISSACKNKKK